MKFSWLVIWFGAALLTFSSCSGKEEAAIKPAPENAVTFTGCRLVRTTDVATWDTTITGATEFVYDANNRIVETRHYYRGNYTNSRTYQYDAQGRLAGSEPYSYFYEYNAAGQLIKRGNQGHIAEVYHYNAAGQVDSSWWDRISDGVYKPHFLTTYAYNVNNRPVASTTYELKADGSVDPVPYDSGYVVAYDNYKSLYALPSYTLKAMQFEPFFKSAHNVLETDQQIFTYAYRPDSLVSEMTSAAKPNAGINGGGTIRYFYDCR